MTAMPVSLQSERIEPLVHNQFVSPSGIRFSVSCYAGHEWSLRDMYTPQDAYRYPGFAHKLARAFMCVGAEDVYAPTPGFNGEIVLRSNLSTMIRLPHNIFLHRNRAMLADGCPLSKRGDAGTVSAGGCGTPIATYGQDLIFAHAGRETILDRKEVLTHGKERGRQRTFVDNLISSVAGECFDPMKLHVWPLYFIGPDEFVHHWFAPNEEHQKYNRAAIQYLPKRYPGEFGSIDKHETAIKIDLPRILRAQLLERGVPAKNVHMEHADLHKELPTTRNGGGNSGRYLVVGVRHTDPQ